MGAISMELYLKTQRWRYRRGNRALKKRMLDEFCDTHGYHRKAAARLLRQPPIRDTKPKKRGKKKIYDPVILLEPIKNIWIATDQMCGKRLKRALPLWLPHYQKHYNFPLDKEILDKLLSMSAATIDRILKPVKIRYGKGLGGTKPGSILKTHIPVKTNQWDTNKVGFMEADTVAHCGTSLSGDFVWSITLTDIFSGWTEMRATWNKGATGVMEGIQNIEANLPFEIKGFDCDNGSEFLNWHLINYFTERPLKPIQFTRSRPYKKDDNAHVEQKNWTHVRQIFGYYRFDNPAIVPIMNNLYANEISMLFNFFYPCIKLLNKIRLESKIKKKYDQPQTPYQRLMASNCLTAEQKKVIQDKFIALDPFDLQKNIQKKLKLIFRLVNNIKQRKAI